LGAPVRARSEVVPGAFDLPDHSPDGRETGHSTGSAIAAARIARQSFARILRTPATKASGLNSVRTISSGQSVRIATRQLQTKAPRCSCRAVLISEQRC